MEILDPTPPDQEKGNGAFCLSRAFILVFFLEGGGGEGGMGFACPFYSVQDCSFRRP